MDDFYAARDNTMPPLPWTSIAPPFTTHNGVDNPFNLLLQDVQAGRRAGEHLKITFADAIEAGLYERIKLVSPTPLPTKATWIAGIRKFYGDDADEELDCIPKAGAGSWLNAKDLAACAHADAGKPELYQGGICYGGRDVARRKDWAAMFAFEDVRGDLWLRDRVEMKDAKFKEQDVEFDRQIATYRMAKYLIDQTGMGEKVVEDCQEEHGETLVQGILFTSPNKLIMATALRQRVEEQTIYIPNDPVFQADLRSIKRTRGTGTSISLAEDGSSDGHGDRFWASALACMAADLPWQDYEYLAASTQKQNGDRDGFMSRGMRAMKGLLG